MTLKEIKDGAIVRQCESRDIEKLIPLFKEAYKYNPRMQELDFIDWQFRNTPFAYNDFYSMLVSISGNEIKGFFGYLPIEFRFDGIIKTGCIAYNWYSVGNDRSGIKLLSELEVRYDNVFHLGCTADSEAIFKVYRIPMGFLERWVAVIDSGKIEKVFNIEDETCKEQLKKSSKIINSKTSSSENVFLCDRFEDNEEFHFDKWKSIRSYIRRTGKYLNWRYVAIPRHNYKIIRADGGQFAVYRIEQIKDQSESVVRILEWNFFGKSAKDALAFIVDEAKTQKGILVDFLSTATEIGKSLEEIGFFKVEENNKEIPYLFRPIYFTSDILLAIDLPPHRSIRDLNFSEWYITKGDSDMDRIKL